MTLGCIFLSGSHEDIRSSCLTGQVFYLKYLMHLFSLGPKWNLESPECVLKSIIIDLLETINQRSGDKSAVLCFDLLNICIQDSITYHETTTSMFHRQDKETLCQNAVLSFFQTYRFSFKPKNSTLVLNFHETFSQTFVQTVLMGNSIFLSLVCNGRRESLGKFFF